MAFRFPIPIFPCRPNFSVPHSFLLLRGAAFRPPQSMLPASCPFMRLLRSRSSRGTVVRKFWTGAGNCRTCLEKGFVGCENEQRTGRGAAACVRQAVFSVYRETWVWASGPPHVFDTRSYAQCLEAVLARDVGLGGWAGVSSWSWGAGPSFFQRNAGQGAGVPQMPEKGLCNMQRTLPMGGGSNTSGKNLCEPRSRRD